MEQTHQCPFPNCDGQMRQATGQYQYGQWFCDNCWFILPHYFFTDDLFRVSHLDEYITKYRQELIAGRRHEIEIALAALRRRTPVDDEPEVAQLLLLAKSLRNENNSSE